jgi:hypothetical protein
MMKENARRMGNVEGAKFYHMALQFKLVEAGKTLPYGPASKGSDNA